MVVGGGRDRYIEWVACISFVVGSFVSVFVRTHFFKEFFFFSAAGSLPFYFALLQRLEKNLRAGLASMSLGFLLYAIPRSN